jgi:hypothetical protein
VAPFVAQEDFAGLEAEDALEAQGVDEDLLGPVGCRFGSQIAFLSGRDDCAEVLERVQMHEQLLDG